MQFRLLGPLEVVQHGRQLDISGIKQRSTLGFLLLHPNSIVATSSLLRALWPKDVPNTSRKMLQNSVSGIRRMLAEAGEAPNAPMLLTHAPGYLLRVDPDDIDLFRCQRLIQVGRDELARGSWTAAAGTLRSALAMWRGSALADLAEAGVVWPELMVLRNTRLAVLEDCIEAELACGRYAEVADELETWVEQEPQRERLNGQLMRALYHSGRQADALTVYRHARSRLISELGLDPSQELQDLERAILNQNLAPGPLPPRRAGVLDPAGLGGPARPEPPTPPAGAAVGMRLVAGTGTEVRGATRPGTEPPPVRSAELKRVSTVLLLARFSSEVEDTEPEDVDQVLQQVGAVVHAEIDRAGGVLTGRVPPLWLGVFGVVQSSEDDAVRAVSAAIDLLHRLGSGTVRSVRGDVALTLSAAVTTGEALVRPPDDLSNPPTATGGLLNRGMTLLSHTAAGEVWVCPETRAASEPTILYATPDGNRGSQALGVRLDPPPPPLDVPFLDRDRQLAALLGALDDARVRSRPQLVTVLGDAGVGKTRLVAEVERAVAADARTTTVVVSRATRPHGPSGLSALGNGLRAYLGVADEPDPVVEERLAEAVRDLMGDSKWAAWIGARLRVLLELVGPVSRTDVSEESFTAWRYFLEAISEVDPLVVVLEDLHWADEQLLDFVEHLAEHVRPVPLSVIVTARPELVDRRPLWGGRADALTTTLDPVRDDEAVRLLVSLVAQQHPRTPSAEEVALCAAVVRYAGGNPRFVVEYARTLSDRPALVPRQRCRESQPDGAAASGRMPAPPAAVRRVVAATIDNLPREVKPVLLGASVLGEGICQSGIAAFGERVPQDVQGALEYLERRGMLHRVLRVESEFVYAFRHLLLRDVAYLMIPQALRTWMHQRAAAWLEQGASPAPRRLEWHLARSAVTTPA